MDEEKKVEEQSDPTPGAPIGGEVGHGMESEGSVKSISTGAALVGVFTSPGDTFKRLARGKPSWSFLLPLVLIIIFSFVSGFLYTSRVDMGQVIREQIGRTPAATQITKAQMDKAVEMEAKFAKFGPYFTIATIPIFFLFLAFIFWLVIMAFGEKLKYGNAFRVVCWSYLPKLLFLLLFILILFIKDPTLINPKNPIMTNLGALFGREKLGKPLYALLSDLDIFTLWILWLYSVGFAAFTKAKTSKTAGIVFGLFALYVLAHVGLAAIL